MLDDGYSQRKICAIFNDEGVLTPSGKAKWKPMMMSKLLKRNWAKDKISEFRRD
jgi:hypothetical protein